MLNYTLAHTAQRILSGTTPTIAIKEHIDAWNQIRSQELFLEEPAAITDKPWLDVWLAGAAEHEAFLIDVPAPEWTLAKSRFLDKPRLLGTKSEHFYAMIETPFAWRRRNLFSGQTMLR